MKYKYILSTLKPGERSWKLFVVINGSYKIWRNLKVRIWIPLFNSPLSLLLARKLETHTMGGRNFRDERQRLHFWRALHARLHEGPWRITGEGRRQAEGWY